MTALIWQMAILVSIVGAFLLNFLWFKNLKRTLQVGFSVVGWWLFWTFGFSALLTGYTLSGQLYDFQIKFIIGVGIVSALVVFWINSSTKKQRLLNEEINRLRESFSDLSAPPKISAARAIRGTASHRNHLLRFIRDSEDHLVILSGWVTSYGFDRDVRQAIEDSLQRNLDVYIGWGYRIASDEASRNVSNQAEIELEKMHECYPHKLHLANFRNHMKLLLTNDKCIVGSFNWLSNKFSKNDELSVIIEDQAYVQSVWESIKHDLRN